MGTNKTRTDFDDLQNENAGWDTGRMARFLSADDPRSDDAKRKKREQQAVEDHRFLELMKDPEYRALYAELGESLREAEQQTDQAIQAALSELAALEQDIADMEAVAAKDPDGNPVFRTRDGRVVNANGEELPIEIVAGIVWPDDAPSGEDYFALKAQRNALAERLTALRGYQTDVLGGIRDRYDDTENPMDKDGLRQALDDIERLRPQAASIKTEVSVEAQISSKPVAFPTFN